MPSPALPAAGSTPLPLLQVVFGSSREDALPTAAIARNPDACAQVLRIYAIGCPLYYKLGTSGVTAPTVVDAFVQQDGYVDTYLLPAQTHIRAVAKSGSGSIRTELLA